MVYSVILDKLAQGQINLLSASIHCALVSASYVPSQSHTSYADIVATQIIATNYTAGGKPLLNKTLNNGRFDADDIQWDDMQAEAQFTIIYNNTPATVTDKTLIACYDLRDTGITNPETSDFIIRWNMLGILNLAID